MIRPLLFITMILLGCGSSGTTTGGSSCNASNCGGCCSTTGRCEVQSASACGVGGGSCVACAGNEVCTAQGACSSTSGVCDSTTCADGCCNGSTCVRGSAAQADATCGKGGGTCSNCTSQTYRKYCDATSRDCRPHRVFASSVTYPANLVTAVPGATSGLDAADKLCAQLAMGAALPGTFKAYLGSGTTTAWSRIANKGPWVQDQSTTTVTEGFAGAGGSPVQGISNDEHGNTVGGYIWTGALNTGAVGLTCSDWTSANVNFDATIGDLGSVTQWTESSTSSLSARECSAKNHLLCFEQ